MCISPEQGQRSNLRVKNKAAEVTQSELRKAWRHPGNAVFYLRVCCCVSGSLLFHQTVYLFFD